MFVTTEGLAFFIVNIGLLLHKLATSSSLNVEERSKLAYSEIFGIGLRAFLEDLVSMILNNL